LVSVGAVEVSAQTGAGIAIRPATIEEPIDPGNTYEYKINVKNLSTVTQEYYLFSRDVLGTENGSVPIFAEEGESTDFQLASWVSLDVTEMTLEPNQEVPVNVTVTVPNDATPGSHFAGVFVSMEPPEMRGMGASIGYEVAAMLSLRVAGDVVESATIRSFATDNFIYSKPEVGFAARIENRGTVLAEPVGPLEINNMFGKRVAQLTFNESAAGILPKETREFDITWSGDQRGFGQYEAVLSLVYGEPGNQATISSTATFWILPIDIILPAIGGLIVLLLLVYVALRLYINRKVAQATGGRRRIVRSTRRGGGGTSFLLLTMLVMVFVSLLFLIILVALFA